MSFLKASILARKQRLLGITRNPVQALSSVSSVTYMVGSTREAGNSCPRARGGHSRRSPSPQLGASVRTRERQCVSKACPQAGLGSQGSVSGRRGAHCKSQTTPRNRLSTGSRCQFLFVLLFGLHTLTAGAALVLCEGESHVQPRDLPAVCGVRAERQQEHRRQSRQPPSSG